MNTGRFAALALITCAASLPVTACTAGVTTASTATSTSAAPSRTAAGTSPSPASSGSTIALGGSIGSFPLPAGAKVGDKVTINGQITIFFGSVTPANVSRFYATALPQAGYAIADNALLGGTEAFIRFTGHGYKGDIATLANFNNPSVSATGVGKKNVTTITFMPK